MAQKTIYRTVHPTTGEVLFLEKGGRFVLWATYMEFHSKPERGFVHVGFSSQADYKKACSAARSSNPHAKAYNASPVTVVTAEERDAETNSAGCAVRIMHDAIGYGCVKTGKHTDHATRLGLKWRIGEAPRDCDATGCVECGNPDLTEFSTQLFANLFGRR